MKNLGVITLLAVLVSCGGNGGSKAKEGATLDPLTQDKFEEAIRSLRPGMVTTETSIGTELDISADEGGRYTVTSKNADSTSTETILNINGDDIYTLVEKDFAEAGRETEREVRKESLERLIADFSSALPAGFSVSIVNNKLSVTGSSTDVWELGANAKINSAFKVNSSVNLNDIRCSERSQMVHTGKMTQNGKVTSLPTTGTTDVGGCGTTLSAAQLRAINLTDVTLCDESTGDEDYSCEYNQDLSHLVQ